MDELRGQGLLIAKGKGSWGVGNIQAKMRMQNGDGLWLLAVFSQLSFPTVRSLLLPMATVYIAWRVSFSFHQKDEGIQHKGKVKS